MPKPKAGGKDQQGAGSVAPGGDQAAKHTGNHEPRGGQPTPPSAEGGNPGGGKDRHQPGHGNRVSDQGGNRGSNTPGQSRGGGPAGL